VVYCVLFILGILYFLFDKKLKPGFAKRITEHLFQTATSESVIHTADGIIGAITTIATYDFVSSSVSPWWDGFRARVALSFGRPAEEEIAMQPMSINTNHD
jgi:hypothetical protein